MRFGLFSEIDKRKARFRKAYETFTKVSTSYDCGSSLMLHLSTEATSSLQIMIEEATWLKDNDPECPTSIGESLERWQNLLAAA